MLQTTDDMADFFEERLTDLFTCFKERLTKRGAAERDREI